MPQQAEQPRPVLRQGGGGGLGCPAANGQQLAGEPHPHQHRHHRFEHVGEDHHEGEGAAEGAVKVGQPRVAAAVAPDIIPENVLGDDHRPVEAAAEVGDHCRHHGRQNGAGAPGRQQGNGMFCETHGAYSSLSPRWRTVSRMGVPSRPKVARTWFSRYRW